MPGVTQLNTDQGMGHYNWGKKVAGHDGKKQHSPVPSMGAFKDKPVAVGYTPVERKMTKAAAGGKTTQMTGNKSQEPKDTHTKSPVRKFKESLVIEDGEDPTAQQDPNAQPAPTAPQPAAGATADTVLDQLPDLVAHAKERKVLDPSYNQKALAQDIADSLGVETTDPLVAKVVKFISVTEKISESLLGSKPKRSFKDQVHGDEEAGSIGKVLGKKPKKHPFDIQQHHGGNYLYGHGRIIGSHRQRHKTTERHSGLHQAECLSRLGQYLSGIGRLSVGFGHGPRRRRRWCGGADEGRHRPRREHHPEDRYGHDRVPRTRPHVLQRHE